MAESGVRDQRVELRLSEGELAGVRDVANARGVSMSDVLRDGLRFSTRTRPVYSFDGCGHSFVRDSWTARNGMDSSLNADGVEEARRRLRAFHEWQVEAGQQLAKFATVTTTSASQVVAPEYRPILASWEQDRPLYAAATRAPITNATPISLPGPVTDANVGAAVATHVQGTNPTDGSLTFGTAVVVTPTGISGLFRVTRELVDSSNPAIDQIALSVMRESFARQTENRIFTALNTAQSGTITAGFVPSGAMARTSAGAALPADLRKTVLAYADGRGRAPRSVVASSRVTVAEALETLDMTAFAMQNVTVQLSPQITGVAAGDGDVFVLSEGDVWAWSSPLLEFQYFERQGPALVDLSLFGYFATAVTQPRGVASIRHT